MAKKKKKKKGAMMPILVTVLTLSVMTALIILFAIVSQKDKRKAPIYGEFATTGDAFASSGFVAPNATEMVSINMPDCTVLLGTIINATAKVTPSGTPVVWISSNPEILHVAENGKVIATGRGIATLTATAGNATDSIIIECVETEEIPVLGFAFYQDTTGNISSTVEDITEVITQSGNVTGNEPAKVPSTEQITKEIPPMTQETTESVTVALTKANVSEVTSSQMPPYLSEIGFRNHADGTYVYEKNMTYYGEVVLDAEKTHFYILQNEAEFDKAMLQAMGKLLPQSAQMVWDAAMQTSTDATMNMDGRMVRIVAPKAGGHRQIVIFN